MNPSDNTTLHHSIRRLLLKRLLMIALALSVLVAALVIFNERDRVGEAVADRAEISVARFNAEIVSHLDAGDDLDTQGLQEALDRFTTINVRQRNGHFVLARIRDLQGNLLAEYEDPEYGDGADLAAFQGSGPVQGRYRIVRIHGAPYVHVQFPLTRSGGSTAAHIDGLYAVSDHAIFAARWRTARGVGIALGIILLTMGAAYPVIRSLLARISGLTSHLLDANLETLQVLGSAIAKRDHDTDAHNYRVTVYSVRLAEAAGLNGATIRSLIKGAFLHDVGKIGIRDNILLKPGKLDDGEFEVMKTHVQHGMEIANRSAWLSDAAHVVGNHHEKFGGKGYPSGLTGQEIPVTARIFAIADVFDALTSARPYKEPFSFAQTMEMLQEGRESHFDPHFLECFKEIARPLYDRFAGQDDELAQQEMQAIIQQYFKSSILDLMVSDQPESPASLRP